MRNPADRIERQRIAADAMGRGHMPTGYGRGTVGYGRSPAAYAFAPASYGGGASYGNDAGEYEEESTTLGQGFPHSLGQGLPVLGSGLPRWGLWLPRWGSYGR